MLEEVFRLLAPPLEAVAHVASPDVGPVGDALLGQQVTEATGALVGDALIFTLAATEDDQLVAVGVEQHARVVLVAQVVERRVAIDEFLGESREEVVGMEEAAERKQRVEQVGTTEEHVACMVTAHRTTRDNQSLSTVDCRDEFFGNVLVPALVQFDQLPVVVLFLGSGIHQTPGLLVDAVATDEVDEPAFDHGSKHIDHAIVLPLPEPLVLTWEHEYTTTPIAEGLVLHLSAESCTPMLVVSCFHLILRFCEIKELFSGAKVRMEVMICKVCRKI